MNLKSAQQWMIQLRDTVWPKTTSVHCLLAIWLMLLVGGQVLAQDQITAPADTLAASSADTLASAAQDSLNSALQGDQEDNGGLSVAAMAAAQSAESQSVSLSDDPDLPYFLSLENFPKSGITSDVRINKYYGQLETVLKMAESSRFSNTLKYSWDDYRQQDKTIEARSDRATYTSGNQLPVKLTANSNWDWSEDNTVNSAGYANLSKREFKTGSVRVNKPKFDLGPLKTIINTSVGLSDQKSVNKDQVNNFSEGYVDGGAQVGGDLTEGLAVASSVFGKSVSGDRTLGDNSSPSSATTDSVAVGVFFDQSFTNGRLSISRSNFDKKYLDYKRNSIGQIDTVGRDEFDKVVDELESTDAVSIELENQLYIGRLGLKSSLARDTSKLAYSQSGVGSKERLTDKADFILTFGTSRDSFSLTYGFMWKWDDQRIKNATENRGRQYAKNRKLAFFYGRKIFKDTDLTLKLYQGLDQDIAQNQFNNNDKDRLRNDAGLEVEREWLGKFKAKLLFAYKQSDEISIRSTQSSKNNVKDSYEVSPGFNWPISDWLTLNQSYRVYIQYTDYVYSELESVNRMDNYSKRGNLNTIVVIKPTARLDLAIRHDYNKRFSATRTITDATGNTFYHTDQKQAINKIDFGIVFRVVEGVTLEGATFRTKDFKESFGATTRETEVYSGEIWVGAKVNRIWGQTNPLELSAIVKKYSAFGPSVTDASHDYWEADVWLKWEF